MTFALRIATAYGNLSRQHVGILSRRLLKAAILMTALPLETVGEDSGCRSKWFCRKSFIDKRQSLYGWGVGGWEVCLADESTDSDSLEDTAKSLEMNSFRCPRNTANTRCYFLSNYHLKGAM